MVVSADLERSARVIAENAISAFGRNHDGLIPATRDALTRAIVRELLAVMPTASGERLAEACNRGLEVVSGTGVAGLRIEVVDLADGSVTMRAG